MFFQELFDNFIFFENREFATNCFTKNHTLTLLLFVNKCPHVQPYLFDMDIVSSFFLES